MNTINSRKWSDEDDDKLRGWAVEGLSASQMARALGGVSRNAIIGRLHRIEVSLKRLQSQRIRKDVVRASKRRVRDEKAVQQLRKDRQRQAAMAALRKYAGAFPLVPDDTLQRLALLPDAARVPCLEELEPHHCRYPVGGSEDGPQQFCGDQRVEGLPYCPRHAVRCYDPPRPKNVSRETLSAPRLKVVA